MKKRAVIAVTIIMVVAISGLWGCGEKDAEKISISGTVRILTTSGAGETGLKNLPEDFKVQPKRNMKKIQEKILAGGWDFAIVDSITAAQLYKETGKNLKVVSPVKYGRVVLFQNGYVQPVKIERVLNEKTNAYESKEVKIDLPLGKFLGQNVSVLGREKGFSHTIASIAATKEYTGFRPDKTVYYGNYKDFATSMDVYNQVGVATGNEASRVMRKNKSITMVRDFLDIWKEQWEQDIPELVLIVNNTFVEKRGKEILLILRTIGKSFAKSNEEGPSRRVLYVESNRGINVLKRFYKIVRENKQEALGDKNLGKDFYYDL